MTATTTRDFVSAWFAIRQPRLPDDAPSRAHRLSRGGFRPTPAERWDEPSEPPPGADMLRASAANHGAEGPRRGSLMRRPEATCDQGR